MISIDRLALPNVVPRPGLVANCPHPYTQCPDPIKTPDDIFQDVLRIRSRFV